MNKIRVTKLKVKNPFELQKYEVTVDDKKIDATSVSVSTDAITPGIITVNVQLITDDFQWIDENSAELLADSPAEKVIE